MTPRHLLNEVSASPCVTSLLRQRPRDAVVAAGLAGRAVRGQLVAARSAAGRPAGHGLRCRRVTAWFASQGDEARLVHEDYGLDAVAGV